MINNKKIVMEQSLDYLLDKITTNKQTSEFSSTEMLFVLMLRHYNKKYDTKPYEIRYNQIINQKIDEGFYKT